jgi:hypothetical protein
LDGAIQQIGSSNQDKDSRKEYLNQVQSGRDPLEWLMQGMEVSYKYRQLSRIAILLSV